MFNNSETINQLPNKIETIDGQELVASTAAVSLGRLAIEGFNESLETEEVIEVTPEQSARDDVHKHALTMNDLNDSIKK
jgi:hypothetical protein